MTKSDMQTSEQDEDEVVKFAESFVTDVESKMEERLKKSKEKAKEVSEDNNDDYKSNPFLSPPVMGAEYCEVSYGTDKIRLKLSSELPTGIDEIDIEAPTERNITDKSHKLNRLLSHYNIKPDNVSNLIGKRIPLNPIGYPMLNKGDANYKIDYPPIPTTPNNILYRLRRFALKNELIRFCITDPYSTKNDVMEPSRPAKIYADIFKSKEQEKFIPTEKSVFAIFSIVSTSLFSLMYLTYELSSFGMFMVFVLSMVGLIINIFFHSQGLTYWTNKVLSSLKQKYFPKSS